MAERYDSAFSGAQHDEAVARVLGGDLNELAASAAAAAAMAAEAAEQAELAGYGLGAPSVSLITLPATGTPSASVSATGSDNLKSFHFTFRLPVGTGVGSFNGRVGAVLPQVGDYTPEMIGAGRVNPNLLDNWYFANPVNQRGQTEYTGVGYTVDRWAGQSAETVVTVTESGITLVGSGAIGYLRQYIEHQEQYLGKKVTLSVLFASGEFSDSTGLIPLAATSESITVCRTTSYNNCYVALILDRSGRLYTQFRCGADTSSEIQAVKLELGAQQTLSHQDANGNWVLNEIPNYGEELAKCQRTNVPLSKSGWLRVRASNINANSIGFIVPVSVEMRARPVLTGDVATLSVRSLDDVDRLAGYSISVAGFGPGYVELVATKENHGMTDAQLAIPGVNAGTIFANADL